MSTEIHSTAIVDPGAEIGDNVKIGPYCVVYAGVKLGDGCWLQNHVTIDGPSEIGSNNRFYAYASIGQQTQDLKYEGEPTYLSIGEWNTFREFSTVNRATAVGDDTRIGSNNNFLAYSHVGHDCQLGNHIIFSNNATVGGHCVVEDYAILSGFVGVHQFCRIGTHAFVGGCTKIVQDVPPFMVADGNPAKVRAHHVTGLKRRDFPPESVEAIKEAYRILYRKDLPTSKAVEEIENMTGSTEETMAIARFVKTTERGIH